MFSHVVVGTNDLAKAKKFYDGVMGALGVGPAMPDPGGHRFFYLSPSGVLIATKPINGEPASHANGGTVGFACSTTAQADAWHAAGVANGGTSCEDPPGRREGNVGKMYLAYLRDSAGNQPVPIS